MRNLVEVLAQWMTVWHLPFLALPHLESSEHYENQLNGPWRLPLNKVWNSFQKFEEFSFEPLKNSIMQKVWEIHPSGKLSCVIKHKRHLSYTDMFYILIHLDVIHVLCCSDVSTICCHFVLIPCNATSKYGRLIYDSVTYWVGMTSICIPPSLDNLSHYTKMSILAFSSLLHEN